MTSRIVREASDWDEALSAFEGRTSVDVYFNYRYHALYSNSGAVPEAFYFGDGSHHFFLPYMRRPVVGTNYFDFESAYGYGGPITTSDSATFLRQAWITFQERAKGSGLVAGFLRFHPLLQNHRWITESLVGSSFNRKTVFADLGKPVDEIRKGYSELTRRQIRRAEKAGMVIKAHQSVEALELFAAIYEQRMHELQARDEYFFGSEYFRAIASLGIERWQVWLAYTPSGETAGGILVLMSGQWAHYHLAATPERFLELAPNSLLCHRLMERLAASGHQRLHFGGGRTADPDDSLLSFKRRIAKGEAEFYTGRFIADPGAFERLCSDWQSRNPESLLRAEFALPYRV